MDFARNAAIRHGCASAIFSLEMSKIEMVMRLLSSEARVPLHTLRSGQRSAAQDELGEASRLLDHSEQFVPRVTN
jgi:replicative DNA helicase